MMNIGDITPAHVYAFQIRCMMSNQYDALVDALRHKDGKGVLIACLRLGWNDAFRHVGKNDETFRTLSDSEKESARMRACSDLIDVFCAYARATDTKSRLQLLYDQMGTVKNVLGAIKKNVTYGQTQKLFNMATKLLVCLLISAEHDKACSLQTQLAPDVSLATMLEGSVLTAFQGFHPETADCPIDSRILEKLGVDATWSKMDKETYQSVQGQIATQLQPKSPNLLYDFLYWQ